MVLESDVSWRPCLGGFLGDSNWEETQNLLKGSSLTWDDLKIPQEEVEYWCGEASLGLWSVFVTFETRQPVKWTDGPKDKQSSFNTY